MNKPVSVYPLNDGTLEVNGHQASIQDIGYMFDAMKAFKNVKLCPMSDVIYISDIFNTTIMLKSFVTAAGCDSKLGYKYKKP